MSQPALRDNVPELEKYELLEEVGHGGMATVYRARDLRLGREVAVKIIHRHLRENHEVATRFVAEARAAASLKHPGIVEVYDVSGEDDPEQFLVVELIRGVTLRKLLSQNADLPAEIAAAITIELCDAIEHAHQSSIIHRDIKPENVLVSLPCHRVAEGGPSSDASKDKDKEIERSEDRATVSRPTRSQRPDVVIKITDFGIAKILDAQGVTSTGQVLGSPAHMAPEQIEGGEVDARTDVFGLGVVFYECLVDHLPFEGKNPAQVLRRVLEGEFSPADKERPRVGRRFAELADLALANQRDDRLASAAELAKRLRAELEDLGLEDPQTEISRFFCDPERYRKELPGRIVPRLVHRGEEARRKRRVPAAAADFNRAHALAPDDLSVLKRLTQLGRQGQRRVLARRLLIVAGASLGLGALAYGAVRALRSGNSMPVDSEPIASVRQPQQPSVPRPSSAFAPQQPPLAPSSNGGEPSEQVPAHTASARVAATPRIASARPSASAAPEVALAERPVKFVVRPTGATLEVDGAVTEHVRAAPYMLRPGIHSARLTPVTADKSTEGAKTIPFTVPKLDPDNPQAAKTISLSLSFRPAKVSLAGPPGGQAVCQNVVFVVGQSAEVAMDKPVWDVTCKFIHGNGEPVSRFFSIRAGENNTLAWPIGGG